MIWFDVTKSGAAGHHSGLTRVSSRLREALGERASPVTWDPSARRLRSRSGAAPRPSDWFLTAELFSEAERPGVTAMLDARPCRMAAIFHDAIPLRHPHITWPQSVARHPSYLKLLARFDRVWAVSRASRDELTAFWQWQGVNGPAVEVLPLGADFDSAPRRRAPTASPKSPPRILCVGILEPRKNQGLLLEACGQLWARNVALELHLVGRINPHFGRPFAAEIRKQRRTYPSFLYFHEQPGDAVLAELYSNAHASAFPTLAEGCGLPLLESLWRGVPCIHSDLPVLRENSGGGCVAVVPGDRDGWADALGRIATDDGFHRQLVDEATSRPLPTWADAAAVLTAALASA